MENNTEFIVGDIVQLMSGGKDMTVIEIDGEEVSCRWFKKSGDLDGAKFRAATLKRVEVTSKMEDDGIDLLNFLTRR